MLRRLILFPSVLAILALAAGPALAIQYTITDLGAIASGKPAEAHGINSSAQVTGNALNDSWKTRAFLWESGAMADLGIVGAASTIFGNDINDNGTIVGDADSRAMIYDSTDGMRYLYGGGTVWSQANAINNNDIVVGKIEVAASENHAFYYDVEASSMSTLENIGFLATCKGSDACDVNNFNKAVGYGTLEGYGAIPFLYDGTTLTDLRTVIAGASQALAINDDGWIAGVGDSSTYASSGFLHNGTTTVALGQLQAAPTVPKAINNNGQVVGYCDQCNDPVLGWLDTKAFLYENGTITDLYAQLDATDQAVWKDLGYATDINDAGQIVGYGRFHNWSTHAFLLTPVPEPSTVALAVMGLAGLLCYAWRRRT